MLLESGEQTESLSGCDYCTSLCPVTAQKLAALLSNIPVKQTALRISDINPRLRSKEVLCLRAAAQARKERFRFQSWNFCRPPASASQHRLVARPHQHTDLCLTVLTRASHSSHTHTHGRYLCFARSPYPRWSVLYPSARHFLLVDDVHELHGVVALHVNHRPLQGVLGHLVELREEGEAKSIPDNVRIQALTLTSTFSLQFAIMLRLHPGLGWRRSWSRTDRKTNQTFQNMETTEPDGKSLLWPSTSVLLLCILTSHVLAGICNLESPGGVPRSSTFDAPL